jgi:hypothetical protein
MDLDRLTTIETESYTYIHTPLVRYWGPTSLNNKLKMWLFCEVSSETAKFSRSFFFTSCGAQWCISEAEKYSSSFRRSCEVQWLRLSLKFLSDASCFEDLGEVMNRIAESMEKFLLNTSVIGVKIYCPDGTICLWSVPRDVQRFVLVIRDVRAGTSSRENSWKYPSFLLHARLVTVNQVSRVILHPCFFPAKLDVAVFNIKPVPIASPASLATLLS